MVRSTFNNYVETKNTLNIGNSYMCIGEVRCHAEFDLFGKNGTIPSPSLHLCDAGAVLCN